MFTSCKNDDNDVVDDIMVSSSFPSITILADNISQKDTNISLTVDANETISITIQGAKIETALSTFSVQQNGTALTSSFIDSIYNDVSEEKITLEQGSYTLTEGEKNDFKFVITMTPQESDAV